MALHRQALCAALAAAFLIASPSCIVAVATGEIDPPETFDEATPTLERVSPSFGGGGAGGTGGEGEGGSAEELERAH